MDTKRDDEPETLIEAWRDFENVWHVLVIEPILVRLTKAVMWITELLRRVLR